MINYRAILLYYSKNNSITQIATICECSRPAVRKAIKRAKEINLQIPVSDSISDQDLYYNEVARYASAVPTVTKHYKNDAHEEWKIGLARLICMKIRRGAVICEFNIQNSEMKDHISGSRVAVKQSQTTVKLEDQNAVSFALESIDLAAKIIEEEKAEKKKANLERRKEKRRQAKQEALSAAAEEAAATEDAE